MLLIGLERGDPTLLACAGLCNIELRLSMLGEHDKGVPWLTGLWTVKFAKLVGVVEDTELIPGGLQTEEVMF